MTHQRIHFVFLNIGHFLDHLFMLVFATVAALALTREWGLSYAELVPYATPSFIAFGVFALPAGWLADKWSREGMMAVFFIGVGIAAAFTAMAETPLEIGLGLLAIGVFASIYHPVGIPLVIEGRAKTGVPIGINGIYGNLGVASAALITGYLIDNSGWRAAFVWPGVASVIVGLGYVWLLRTARANGHRLNADDVSAATRGPERSYDSRMVVRIFAVILITTGIGGVVYQSTTFALPKIFDERLGELALSATLVGRYAFLVFAFAAVAQLIVGFLVDNFSLRLVFVGVAALQVAFFTIMPGLENWAALCVAVAFMLVVFGQIPINDVLLGRVTRSEWRSRAYACRYIVTFTGVALAMPMISLVHSQWGFDTLFRILAIASCLILLAVVALPRVVPQPVPAGMS